MKTKVFFVAIGVFGARFALAEVNPSLPAAPPGAQDTGVLNQPSTVPGQPGSFTSSPVIPAPNPAPHPPAEIPAPAPEPLWPQSGGSMGAGTGTESSPGSGPGGSSAK
jgi:hypothetical protein